MLGVTLFVLFAGAALVAVRETGAGWGQALLVAVVLGGAALAALLLLGRIA